MLASSSVSELLSLSSSLLSMALSDDFDIAESSCDLKFLFRLDRADESSSSSSASTSSPSSSDSEELDTARA